MNHHDRRLTRRQLLSAAADGAHVLTHMYPQWRSGSGTVSHYHSNPLNGNLSTLVRSVLNNNFEESGVLKT